MHELSVALALLDEIGEAAEREGATAVSSVRLRVGRLSGIAPEALLFAWDLARAHTIAAAAQLHIEAIEVALFCERCRLERSPSVGGGLACDVCGTVAASYIRGRELELVAMEVLA